jgi:outer membrane lipoprotein-sorting protein
MRPFLLIAFVFLRLTSFAHCQPLSPDELKNLLAQIKEKRGATPQMQADFHEAKFIRLMNKPVTSAGSVWFQAPNKFRREVKGNSPSVTLSDGQQLWIYYPGFKSVERYSLGARSPLDATIAALLAGLNLQNIESSYGITATKIANGYELDLLPRRPSLKRFFQRLNVQIDEDFRARRTEMLAPNGDRIVTTYANYVTGPIPSSEFEFTPPPGTEVTTPLGR